jgi:acyl carrier protein
MNFEKKIREIVATNIKTTESIDTYDADGSLQDIGMDSLTFVRIVVAIENEFEIEFPDDKLIITEAGTIALLCNLLESVLGGE